MRERAKNREFVGEKDNNIQLFVTGEI